MPKPHTFPTLYDELKTISISFLSKHGYLNMNQWRSGTITWSRNGQPNGNISISVNTLPGDLYVELDYTYNNETKINYKVRLVSQTSNLGKGLVWYFICPHTGKRCRKLHLLQGYFFHRSAFRGCMYEKQAESKRYRHLDKTLGPYFRADQLYHQINKKHFKKQYAGKPTKKYLKLTRELERAETIPHSEIMRLIQL